MTIQRIVCFKFKAGVDTKDQQSHMSAFAELKSRIPQIIDYSAGRGLSGDFGSAPQYDTLHFMTFNSMEDVDLYFEHPAHQEFIENYKHLWDSVLVLNADQAESSLSQ